MNRLVKILLGLSFKTTSYARDLTVYPYATVVAEKFGFGKFKK